MSYLTKILEHDLHKSKGNNGRVLFLETPGSKNFLPCVVSSSTKGKFLVNNSITNDNRIRSGVFFSSEETIDDILGNLIDACYLVSKENKYGNSFNTVSECLKYIKSTSGFNNLPSYCIAPLDLEFSGCDIDISDDIIDKSCKIIRARTEHCVFLSKPDYVGLYSRLPNNYNSIIIHNINLGMAFYVK